MQPDVLSTSATALLTADVRRFPWIRRLASDYAFSFEKVAPFFAGDPRRQDAWAEAIRRAQAHQRQPAELARIIQAQQAARDAPPEAKRAAARLADPRTVVVITGQQAGVFGGPLFTLLKAITAMKLATETARRHEVPVIPVFWIDAEDHDWREIYTCGVLDAELQPRTVRLRDLPGAGEVPVARLTFDDTIELAVAELDSALPPSEFRGDLLRDLRRAYRPGTGVAQAFGQWMESVLGRHGLVVYDSSDAASKMLAHEVFAREISTPGATAELAAHAGRELIDLGYHAQVEPAAGAISLFYLNGGREAVRATGDRVLVGDRETSAAALADEARTHPEHFSPNVLLRPVVQDTIFPTICYVAGPNELGYLGQLRAIYSHFGVPMPLMYQRATATLVDSSTFRFLTRYEVAIEALQPQDESALNRLLTLQLPPTVEQALTAAGSVVADQMEAVAQVVPQIDPTLEGTVRSTLVRMQHDLHTLHNKVINAAKKRDDTLRRQFTRAQALTFPHGEPQERAVGSIWFLNRYGPALVDRLLEDLPLEMGHHSILAI